MPKFENINDLVGVPTDLQNKQEDIHTWNNLSLEDKIVQVDSLVLAADYAKNQEKKEELLQYKSNLVKYYLGEEMTAEEFAAFEKALTDDPSKKEKLDTIAKEKKFDAIKQEKETLVNQVFGRELAELNHYNTVVDVPEHYKHSSSLQGVWQKSDLNGKMLNIDSVIMTILNAYSTDHLKESYEIKGTLLKHYLGQGMSDDEFAAFEKALSEDPKKNKMFDTFVKDFDSNEIQREKDTLTKALFGKELATMRRQKDENAKVPTENELKEAAEKTEKLLKRPFLRSHRETITKSYLRQEQDNAKETIKKAQATLGLAVPNRATNGPQMKNPFANQEEEKEAQYKAAAQIVASKIFPLKSKKDAAILDMGSLLEEDRIRKGAIEELQQDPDFRAFVLSEIAKKDAERFEPDRMVDSWEAYRKTLDEARENYRQELSIARENGPVPESLAFFHPDVRGNVAGDNNGFAVVEKNDGNLSTKENLKAQAQAMLDSAERDGRDRALEQKDFLKAANLVVANALLTKAADLTFFETEGFKNEQGDYRIDKMNKSLVELRDQVIADPLFQKVLSKRVKETEVVSSYQREVNREVNKKISRQEKRESEYKKDQTRSQAHQKYAAEHTVELTAKEIDFIKETYANIKKFNEGKDPSDLMKKLTTALDAVTATQGNKISVEKMEALNKATLEYYKERQGKIFSPLTKRGKARLGAVERMAFLTDDVMDRAAKQEKKEMKNQAAKAK